jgi:hypothetical protein
MNSFFQTKDKKFLNELAHDKKYLENMINQLTRQTDTPSQLQGFVQKQVKSINLANGYSSSKMHNKIVKYLWLIM